MYRAGAIIIQAGALLLVTGGREESYWTPGGRIEPGESPEEAVRRELLEELGISVDSAQYFLSYQAVHSEENEPKEFGYFLVEHKGEPRPQEDISKLLWLSKEAFLSGRYSLTKTLQQELVPKLIQEKLVY